MEDKPSDIIMWLKEIEEQDFSLLLTVEQLQAPYGPDFSRAINQDHPTVDQICSSAPYYDTGALPEGLRKPTPVPTPKPGTRDRETHTPAHDDDTPSRAAKKRKKKSEPFPNPKFNSRIKAYWEANPELSKKNLGELFKNANKTVGTALGVMGLEPSSCAIYHFRGICDGGGFCKKHRFKHEPKDISADAAEQICAMFDKSK